MKVEFSRVLLLLLLLLLVPLGSTLAQNDDVVTLRLLTTAGLDIQLEWIGGRGQFDVFRSHDAATLRTAANRIIAVRERTYRDGNTPPTEPLLFYSVEGTALCGNGSRDLPLETCDPPGDPARDSPSGEVCRADCTFCFDGVSSEDRCAPLLVVLESFTAEQTRQGVLVRWTTTIEVDNVGFRLYRAYRERGRLDRLVLLTPHVIPARGSDLTGANYEFVDDSVRGPGVVAYYLEDIDLLGGTTSHPPVVIELH